MKRITNQDEKFEWMTTAPLPGLIGTLAVPTIVSMMITSIYNMADTFFVGRIGTSAQGAVGVVFSLMAIIQALGFTFGSGAGNYISRLLGRKDRALASRVAATGFFSALGVGLVLAVLGLVFLDPLVRLLGATDTILPYARDYARYILLGAPYMAASLVLNNLLRYQGSAFYSMLGIATGAVLNIALDPIFIFVLDLKTGGAALATILSQLVSFLILLSSCGRGGTLRIRPSHFTFSWPVYREIFRGGLPSLYRQGLASVATICLNRAAGPFGDAAIAAMSVVTRVSMFANSALLGFGQGFQPVCGFNFGARLYGRVRRGYCFCLKLSAVFLAAVAVLGFLFAPQIIAVFRREDPAVIAIGAQALRFQCFTLPLSSLIILNNMMLQTVGEAGKASVLALARQGLFFLPAILLLPSAVGLAGVQLAQPTADLCTFLLSVPMGLGFLRKMRGMEAAQPLPKPDNIVYTDKDV